MSTPRRRGVVYMRLSKDGRKRLAKLLVIQDVSHRKLAEAVGWKSHTMVRQLLVGERAGVSLESAHAIAHYLGVSVDDLFLTEMPNVSRRGTHGKVDAA